MLDISCIIVNYKSHNYTLDCVKSIIEKVSRTINYEIVIVDNGSEYDDYLELKKGISSIDSSLISIFRSKINTGFGAGNMQGVLAAKPSKYLAFINNDCELLDDSFSILKDFMDNNQNIGVSSPQMIDENNEFVPTIDHFASIQREILKRKPLEFLFPKVYLKRYKQYKEPVKAQFIAGSFMFFRTEDFNAIGGFDTNIFLYYEETDTCRRLLKQLKKDTYLVPQSTYKHHQGKSTMKNIDIKIEQKLSLFYIIRKHYGIIHSSILWLYFSIRYFFTSFIKPKYWKLFLVLLIGAPLSLSLKHTQKVHVQ
jgi:GT2 family glycosyltransferase